MNKRHDEILNQHGHHRLTFIEEKCGGYEHVDEPNSHGEDLDLSYPLLYPNDPYNGPGDAQYVDEIMDEPAREATNVAASVGIRKKGYIGECVEGSENKL